MIEAELAAAKLQVPTIKPQSAIAIANRKSMGHFRHSRSGGIAAVFVPSTKPLTVGQISVYCR
jgi:hypothetical protein